MVNNYQENCAMQAPGLAIKAGGSAIVKAANAFSIKANGVVVGYTANTDMAGLATALGVDGAATSDLADLYTRVYTFLLKIDSDGTKTLSVVHGADFLTSSRPVNTSDFNLGNVLVDSENFATETKKYAVIGYAIVANATGAVFVPGTTPLDTGSLTVTYIDAFGFVGL